ncbi:hypothetical protein OH782_00820 [Streptomyces sp. NBC_01544]|uniref:hypothetical protein n=1 Tax=unclassified Streptomyces TaxID=2593676 RepID=UPI002ED25339|nr:hypothetical protein OG987_41920 [Streptomyces sp. NBC_01620]WTE65351.1 hypothetical protein OG784_41655 [Streptomyces sp. NBC_01617]WTI92718.1 hypothetical protein OHB17_40980 [Streptomyces sp. NBC_00724]
MSGGDTFSVDPQEDHIPNDPRQDPLTVAVLLIGTAFVALIAVLYPSLVPALGVALATFMARSPPSAGSGQREPVGHRPGAFGPLADRVCKVNG